MNTTKPSDNHLDSLLVMLSDTDGMIRQSARESLVGMGGMAVMPLTRALQNSTSDQVRWEAAKALGALGDARSIQSLVKALEDKDSDVVWLAAEALSSFGRTAWPTLLKALIIEGTESPTLRQAAHHVFANQKEGGFHDSVVILLSALEAGKLPEAAPIAAIEFLKQLNAQ